TKPRARAGCFATRNPWCGGRPSEKPSEPGSNSSVIQDLSSFGALRVSNAEECFVSARIATGNRCRHSSRRCLRSQAASPEIGANPAMSLAWLVFRGPAIGALAASLSSPSSGPSQLQSDLPRARLDTARVGVVPFTVDPSDTLLAPLAYGLPDLLTTDLA